jgi:alpha-mannosidase
MTAAPPRKKVLFTFGNHMHWVDMQWLWGYGVLPGSMRDMLHLCREAGVKGNINFDGIGYEKMAAECPEALAELRDAVQRGIVEPVGCSYGQPYGLFHGGESNIRQFTFGVRSVLRLLGVRPRAFWEEEFYFFPQLPQILRGCGFQCANLYFQWTWHTPEVPREPHALILWEGIDGTRIPTLPRNALNLHQWPEDFELLGGKGSRHQGNEASRAERAAGSDGAALLRDLPLPAIVQWLELMPSKDWMCRSDLLLPKLKGLLAHPEYEIVPGTMSEVVAALIPPPSEGGGEGVGGAAISSNAPRSAVDSPHPPTPSLEGRGRSTPIRAYTMDEVWHGMTLGKNEDRHPKESRQCEAAIIGAEALSALMGLLGRPYPRWDVYPSWELDEAWRDLLAAQHHDNHECEGLCGDIGYTQMARAAELARRVESRAWSALADRFGNAREGCRMAFNPTGVTAAAFERQHARYRYGPAIADVPPFGYRVADAVTADDLAGAVQVIEDERTMTLKRGKYEVSLDRGTGFLQIRHPAWPDGVFDAGQQFPRFRFTSGGETRHMVLREEPTLVRDSDGEIMRITCWLVPSADVWWRVMSLSITLDPSGGVGLTIVDSHFSPDDPGLKGALTLEFTPAIESPRILADTPYACGLVDPRHNFRRKYPEGDWMTSPQWFETVERPFTGHRFVEFCDGEGPRARGVLVLTHGTQQWLRTDRGARLVVYAHDPWDEERAVSGYEPLSVRIFPHGGMTNADRIRLAMAFESPSRLGGYVGMESDLPCVFAPFDLTNAPNVIAHAFFRMCEKDGEHLPNWAGHRMIRESGGACTHPFAVRLVEWDGEPADVTLKFPGEIALCAKTNLLGEVVEEGIEGSRQHGIEAGNDTRWLTPEPTEPPEWVKEHRRDAHATADQQWSQVRFTMRPREIATIMADLVMGRKQFRDLDAKREVWATVHREKG